MSRLFDVAGLAIEEVHRDHTRVRHGHLDCWIPRGTATVGAKASCGADASVAMGLDGRRCIVQGFLMRREVRISEPHAWVQWVLTG